MLIEISKKQENVDMSIIRGGGGGGPEQGICANCRLCGSSGNDEDFQLSYFE